METFPEILRHKTAIRRVGFSLPVRCLLRDGLLDSSQTLFDYGCGRGQDLEFLQDLQISCRGWDPVHRPDEPLSPADVVNLSYVINVIENPHERAEVLRKAWNLCLGVLVVAAQLDFAASGKEQAIFADGVVTSRNTFQKYFTQSELRTYIERILDVEATPAAPGVFYVFRSESVRQQFLANRFHRVVPVPRARNPETLFETHQAVLQPFMEALARLGRLPGPEDFPEYAEMVARLGSPKRALSIVNRVTGAEAWTAIAAKRAEDLLVFLALSRFPKRPPLSALPTSTQRDAKAFFGTYQRACTEADALLFRVGDPEAIEAACARSTRGCLEENALLIRHGSLMEMEPILRIYEGCARALSGEIENVDVIKLHRRSGKVSYLGYEDFENDLRPRLLFRVKVTLPSLAVDFYDHSGIGNESYLESKERLE